MYNESSVDIAKKLHISSKTVNRYFNSCSHELKNSVGIKGYRCICYDRNQINSFLNENTIFFRRTKYININDFNIDIDKLTADKCLEYLCDKGINKNISLFAVYHKQILASRQRKYFPYIPISKIDNFYILYSENEIEKVNVHINGENVEHLKHLKHSETAERYWFENAYIKAQINVGNIKHFVIHLKDKDIINNKNNILIPACYKEDDIYKETLTTHNDFIDNISDFLKNKKIQLPVWFEHNAERQDLKNF